MQKLRQLTLEKLSISILSLESLLKGTPYGMSPMIYLLGTPHGMRPMSYLLGTLHSKRSSDRIQKPFLMGTPHSMRPVGQEHRRRVK